MTTIDVRITTAEGIKKTEPYGEHNRCDNCGMPENVSKDIVYGGELCDTEWACCVECHDEMLAKGCAFEELGDMTYRQQKY